MMCLRYLLLGLHVPVPLVSATPTIVPRIQKPPIIDGSLADDCWKKSTALDNFSTPQSSSSPAKKIVARLCFDRAALYLAFVCDEPNPDRIKTRAHEGSRDVWQDDCIEIWIRTTSDRLEFDQFIANAAGVRQSLRRRQKVGAGGESWKAEWEVRTRIAEKAWSAEIRIPFSTLGVTDPKPGQTIQLKLGREDYAGKEAALSTWPPGSRYAGSDDYAIVYFERANLLRNPDMAERDGKRASGWGYTKGDESRYSPAKEDDTTAIHVQSPGRYSTAQQSIRLEPNSRYLLAAQVKGSGSIYLRSRTAPAIGAPSRPYTVWTKTSETYLSYEVAFPTGPGGEALILIGCTEKSGKGEIFVADMSVRKIMSTETVGPAIPIKAGEKTIVKKLLVTDCRAVRGFIGTPVDGTTQSRGWNAQFWEYPRSGAGVGVGYSYRKNDGLHITLADGEGVDAILIRSGAKAKLYRDCEAYNSPESGTLIHTFPGGGQTSRALFGKRVMSRKFSFFEVSDGYLADVSFYRIGRDGQFSRPEVWGIDAKGNVPDAGKVQKFLTTRYPRDGQKAMLFAPDQKASSLQLEARKTIHFVSAPLKGDLSLSAILLSADVRNVPSPAPFTFAVQDVLNPRTVLFEGDFLLSRFGRLDLVADIFDQVIPKGNQIWLSLSFQSPAKLRDLRISLHRIKKSDAIPEALAYRKLKMKTWFAALSEPRPWNGWYSDKDIERSLKSSYGPQLRELRETIGQCVALGPDDIEVKQYSEWFWRRNRKWRKDRNRNVNLDSSHAKVESVEGAPEWAVVVRQAWLEARKVPEWWLDHRLVPTGEFGGVMNDDTDMYQNYVNFPMLEQDGTGGRLRDAADRLMQLADKENLRQGLNRRTMDPLHAYEEGLNHEALLAWWNYGDPVSIERCMEAAAGLEALTTLTARGHRHFKSQRLGAEDLGIDRKTDVDGHAHPLMLHPAFELAWYNAHPKVMKMLQEWADGWLEHMKPGKYATGVEVATEKVTSTTHRPLYGGYGALGSAFTFMYWLNGEEKYLSPFFDQFAAGSSNTSPGNILPELLHRHGLLTKVDSKLPKITREGLSSIVQHSPVAQWIQTGDKTALIDALKRDIAEMQNYGVMYTSAEVFTDRVFLYAIQNASMCYTGGFAARNKFCHTHAASWEGFGTDYAALVRTARPNEFHALVYNFKDEEQRGTLRLWTLQHGQYKLFTGTDANEDDEIDTPPAGQTLEIQRATSISLALPPRAVTVVRLEQTEKLDDERRRPDLAISISDIHVKGQTLRLVIHNIGSKDAGEFEVSLLDARGKPQSLKKAAGIEAPLDLKPRRLELQFDLPAQTTGWSLAIDPANRIPEIFEGNNRVALPTSNRPRKPAASR